MDRFVTRSRRGDLLLLALLALLILGFAGRLRVYYQVPGWAKRAAEAEQTSQQPAARDAPDERTR